MVLSWAFVLVPCAHYFVLLLYFALFFLFSLSIQIFLLFWIWSFRVVWRNVVVKALSTNWSTQVTKVWKFVTGLDCSSFGWVCTAGGCVEMPVPVGSCLWWYCYQSRTLGECGHDCLSWYEMSPIHSFGFAMFLKGPLSFAPTFLYGWPLFEEGDGFGLSGYLPVGGMDLQCFIFPPCMLPSFSLASGMV